MAMIYSGSDVRIADDRRVWVLVPAEVGWDARWRPVTLEQIRLDMSFPDELISPHARHPLHDLGIDARKLSHVLGLPRCDPRRAQDLFTARFLHGTLLALDSENKEFAHRRTERDSAEMIYPYSAVEAVTGQHLIVAPHRKLLALGNFPMPADHLAREFSAPFQAGHT
jgi:hypothetical protein